MSVTIRDSKVVNDDNFKVGRDIANKTRLKVIQARQETQAMIRKIDTKDNPEFARKAMIALNGALNGLKKAEGQLNIASENLL